MPMMDQYFT